MRLPGIASQVAGFVDPFRGPAKWIVATGLSTFFIVGMLVGAGIVADPAPATQFDAGEPEEGRPTTISGMVKEIDAIPSEIRGDLYEEENEWMTHFAWFITGLPVMLSIEAAKWGVYTGAAFPGIVKTAADGLIIAVLAPMAMFFYSLIGMIRRTGKG